MPSEVLGRTPRELFWRRFKRDRLAIGSMVFLVLIILMAFGAPLFARLVHHPVEKAYVYTELSDIGLPRGPNGTFWLGADASGRDLLVGIMYGARTSLTVALSATAIEVVLGVLLGTMAGYYRGKTDTVISRAIDVFYALPTLLLILGIVAACGATRDGCLAGTIKPGMTLVAVVIGIFGWPYIARVIRGSVLSIREREFVEAARASGETGAGIMWREILPNIVGPVIVFTTLLIPTNILIEAALSFLGIGVPPNIPSWGNLINAATGIFTVAWWTMLFPGLFLLATTLAFNLVGDGLRDALDPKTISME